MRISPAKVSCIKDLCDQLSAIGDTVSKTDMVTITLKGLIRDYHVLISNLGGGAVPPTFNELTGILLQEEERMKVFEMDSQSSEVALMAKWKNMTIVLPIFPELMIYVIS